MEKILEILNTRVLVLIFGLLTITPGSITFAAGIEGLCAGEVRLSSGQ